MKGTSFRLSTYLSTLMLALLMCAGSVLGAEDTFIVEQLVGGDITSPTVPGNFTATPVSISQIDLDWDASTDNYLMGGYQIWRDDAFLATTTATSYSDVGLTASTTYTYFIFAFDSFFNYSASTTPVSTTTLRVPPPTPTSTATTTPANTTGSRIRAFADQIRSIEIIQDTESVRIRYTTHGYIRPVVRWGKTGSYELGSIAHRTFGLTHETRITGLTPGATYYFTIEGENKYGRYGVLYEGDFMTYMGEDTFPPANVRLLTATQEGDDIILSWENPKDSDFTHVRVVRGETFYPYDTAGGWVVYEGEGETVRDRGVLTERDGAYYTVFAYDVNGNISSGAIVSFFKAGVTPPIIVDAEKNELNISFEDILFTQEAEILSHDGGRVVIDGAKQFRVALPYELLPQHLKTILITMKESEWSNRTFSFLLRANNEKTYYESTIAPFGRGGSFPVQLSVFDYKTAQIGYADGTIISRILSLVRETGGVWPLMSTLFASYWPVIFTFFLILIVILIRKVLIHPV